MTSRPGQLFKEVGRRGSGTQYMTQIAGDISVIPKISLAQSKKTLDEESVHWERWQRLDSDK